MDDEGAQITRFCNAYDEEGLHFFVYGRSQNDSEESPTKYARQTLEASQKVAEIFKLKMSYSHNNRKHRCRISSRCNGVGNKNLYFYHEKHYQTKTKHYKIWIILMVI